ncbi:MAG: hypothetical protein VX112_05310 [Pseudomonadota bacterium]|nr:hypothetical protein [Pseudomonadota bacterium]
MDINTTLEKLYTLWINHNMSYFTVEKRKELPEVAYFLQEMAKIKYKAWYKKSRITEKVTEERKQAIYNTQYIPSLLKDKNNRIYNHHVENTESTCLEILTIANNLEKTFQDINTSAENKLFFLKCVQNVAEFENSSMKKSDKKYIYSFNKAQVNEKIPETFDEAKTYYAKQQSALPKNVFQKVFGNQLVSALSDIAYIRNHSSVQVIRTSQEKYPLLRLDRSASFGSHNKSDNKVAVKSMIALLQKWVAEDRKKDQKFIFMTLIQDQVIFGFESTIAYNNITALAEIKHDLETYQTLKKNTCEINSKTAGKEEKSDLQNRIDLLEKKYSKDVLEIDPNDIIYTNIQQWNAIPNIVINIVKSISFIWRFIYYVFTLDNMILKKPQQASPSKPIFNILGTKAEEKNDVTSILEKLVQEKLSNLANKNFKTTEHALRYKLHATLDMINNPSDPAHKAAALAVLANLAGARINITCKSGKDRTGIVSALAANFTVALDENAFRMDIQRDPIKNYDRKSLLSSWNTLLNDDQVIDIQARLSSQNAQHAKGVKSWEHILEWNTEKNPGLDAKLERKYKLASILANNNRFKTKKPSHYDKWQAKQKLTESLKISAPPRPKKLPIPEGLESIKPFMNPHRVTKRRDLSRTTTIRRKDDRN